MLTVLTEDRKLSNAEAFLFLFECFDPVVLDPQASLGGRGGREGRSLQEGFELLKRLVEIGRD